ncbi:acyl-CoA synthetase [Mycobacterium hubeiense]|uniref:acyl-CoA synthetase n=1 Tax=Mycobacterium hubeiense TaxID=1867256 RepID=UPI000C7E8C7A|nr:acyl-CoA synthetase [Mycobacterium sp. QGD 101]
MPETQRPSREREKLDEDDHDLLTFGEAGERLRLEIAAARDDVARLQDAGETADLEKARARLEALRAAADRNSAQPINDANFEKFFGYPGKAKRNLPTSPAIE